MDTCSGAAGAFTHEQTRTSSSYTARLVQPLGNATLLAQSAAVSSMGLQASPPSPSHVARSTRASSRPGAGSSAGATTATGSWASEAPQTHGVQSTWTVLEPLSLEHLVLERMVYLRILWIPFLDFVSRSSIDQTISINNNFLISPRCFRHSYRLRHVPHVHHCDRGRGQVLGTQRLWAAGHRKLVALDATFRRAW